MTTPTQPRLLVIDDEIQIRRLLRITLEPGGFDVLEAETGLQGLTKAAAEQPAAIVLDLGLPDLNGFEVVRRLRVWSQVPVLVLTVQNQVADKIAALDAGADDYLTKPFNGDELMAHVRAILRRARPSVEQPVICFGEIEINLVTRIVRRKGKDVHLTSREYEFLCLLARHRGKVMTHGQILRELWGPLAEKNNHYLRVFMTHMRQKLEEDPHNPRHLRTEPGIGFRLSVE